MAKKPNLTEPEEKLVACAARGEVADFRASESKTGRIKANDPRNNPGKGGKWGKTRTIRASVLRRLLVDRPDDWPVHAKGVKVWGAKINGSLDLEATEVNCPLLLIGCRIMSPISLTDARTRGLFLGNCWIAGLQADRLNVKGSLILGGTTFNKGEVRLGGSKISGQLICSSGTFHNPKGFALNAQDISVKGGVFLDDGFSAKGGVSLSGAEISGQLGCSQGSFHNPKGFALNAQGISVKGDVFLIDGFSAKGEVSLSGAKIDGPIMCSNGTLENEKGIAFSIQNAKVMGPLFWQPKARPQGAVIFQHAQVGPLSDAETGWPEPGKLFLDGFEYSSLAPGAPQTAEERLDWLRRQTAQQGQFVPQPYEHLIKVFREMGHTRDAREIGIAKHEDFRLNGCCIKWHERFWNWTLGVTISHGYRPWNVFWWMLGVVIIGLLVFSSAETTGNMHPAKERILVSDDYKKYSGPWKPDEPRWAPADYPKFNPFIYSLDVFLPIVDLHQENYWLPGKTGEQYLWGLRYKIWLWAEILLGWFLTTIAVAGLTGIIKKD